MLKRIKEYIDSKHISVSAFERSIGMSNASFGKSLKNNGAIGSDKLENILNIYPDINAEWLITGKGSMLKGESMVTDADSASIIPQISFYNLKTDYYGVERQIIPLYEVEASAGLSLLFSNQAQQIPLDHIILPNAPKCDGAMYIRGDSMYPLLKSGDIACYKTIIDLENVICGEKYILDISNGDDDYLTVKYVQKSDRGNEYFKLVSENKHHADRDVLKSTIRALAMVKATIRFETLA